MPNIKKMLLLGVLLLPLLLTFSRQAEVTSAASNDNNVEFSGLGHDSRDPLYRTPSGAVPTGTPIRLRLRAADGDLSAAQVRVWNDRENTSTLYPMTRIARDVALPGDPGPYEFWEATLPASPLPTVYWYRFVVVDGSDTDHYEDDAGRTGGWGQAFDTSPDNSYQLTIFDPGFTTPDWVKNGIIYQIFPDRFRDGNPANNPSAGQFFYGANDTIYRSNGTNWNDAICDPRSRPGAHEACANAYSQNFYGGDLQGITDNLDYIDSLGVTVLYLNPIFESPSNHKYDTTDFFHIDDNFGTLGDFITLTNEAHARGIRVVLDGVFNHSSSDSVYFDRYSRWTGTSSIASFPTSTATGTNDASGACETTASGYTDWYTFFPYVGAPPAPCSNNRDYPKWFGIFDSLPVYQHDNPEVRDYFINNGVNSVGPYWMQWADGWRLDVAPEIDHGTINDPTDDYWEDFRTAVHGVRSDAYIVGEEWGNPTSWTIGGEWDATMNYQFASAVLSYWRDSAFTDNDFNSGSSAGVLNPLNAAGFNERFLNLQERYAPEAFYAMMNLFNSHDTNRVLFLLDHNTGTNNTGQYANPNYDWSPAITRLRGAVLMQMTLPGAPTIYYGDEVGTVGPVSHDGGQWQDDPYNRVPYPWLDQTGTPYYTHMQTPASQDALRTYYTTLTSARNSNQALRTGTFDVLSNTGSASVLTYGRKMENDSSAAVVAVNKSNGVQNITIDVSGYIPAGAIMTNVLAGGTVTVSATGEISVSVPAQGGVLLTLNSFAGRPGEPTISAVASANAITVNWASLGGGISYDVYRSEVSGGGYFFLGNTATNSYVDNTVESAKPYYYVVVAKNATNLLESGYSNEVTATAAYTINWANLQWPPTISHITSAVTPTPVIYGRIYIAGVSGTQNAVDPTPGVTAEVGYGNDGTLPTDASWQWFPATFNVNAGNNEEFQGTMLVTSPAGNYDYLYRYSTDGGVTWVYGAFNDTFYGTLGAYNPANAGQMTVTAGADSTPPDAPTNLTVGSTTTTSISLSWDAHPNGAGDLYSFRVFRRNVTAGEVAFTQVGEVINPAATSYTDNTVTSSNNYDYYIVAVDTSVNISAQSNTVNADAIFLMVNVTFRVTVPDPSPGTVYVAGGFPAPFPSWNPSGIALTETAPGSGVWEVTLSILDGTSIEYKYTRGSWERVEKEADGATEVNNRPLLVDYGTTGTMLITDTVANWRDPIVTAFTPADGATGLPNNTVITATWNQAMPTNPGACFAVSGTSGAVAGTFTYDAGTRTHTFTPTTALPGDTYTVNISGCQDSAGGDSQQVAESWSFDVAPAADTTPPAAPTNLNVDSFDASSVSLSWDLHPDTDGDLDGFTIERENVATPGYAPVGTVSDPLATTFTDNTVVPGVTYNYRIRAVDTSGNPSLPSNVVNVAIPQPVIAVTFSVTVPAGTPGTVYIAGNFDSFSGSPYPGWNPGGIPLSETSPGVWAVTLNIPAGTNLAYKYARGSWETVEKAADGNTDIPDRTLVVTDQGGNAQTVNNTVQNWRDPYVVSFSPANGSGGNPENTVVTLTWNQAMPATPAGFSLIGPLGIVSGTWSYDAGTRTHTFTPSSALTPGTQSAVIAGASDNGGDSQQTVTSWNFTSIAGVDTTPPAAPTNLALGTLTSSSVQLTWDAHPNTDGDLAGFEIWRDDGSGFIQLTTVNNPAATSYTDNTVMANSPYDYYIIATDTSANDSAPSNTVTANVPQTLVAVTFTVTVPTGTPGSVYIAGNFDNFGGSPYPNWSPNGIALTETSPGVWEVTLNLPDGIAFVYKYTRGSWETVEKQADGNADIPDRPLTVSDGGAGTQAVNNIVANWRDPYVTAFTPADLSTGNPVTTVVTVTWNQGMPATPAGFTLNGTSGAITGTFSYDAGTFTHTFTPDAPLAPDTYTVNITGATDNGGDNQQVAANWTFEVATVPDTVAPAAPSNLVVLSQSASSINLGWDAHPNTDGDLVGFYIFREVDGTPGFTQIATVPNPAAVSYVDNTVAVGTTYNYYIQAYDTSANASGNSNTVQGTAADDMVTVTFTVTIPAGTPGTIYIAGNFDAFPGSTYPNWDPAGLVMTQVNATTWRRTLILPDGATFVYKYTRGSWETVEKQADGNTDIPDRPLTVTDSGTGTQAVNDTIAGWRDPYVVNTTPANGQTVLPSIVPIVMSFNQAINDASATFNLTCAGNPVTGSTSYDAATNTLTFTPAAALPEGVCTVSVTGVQDAGGDTQQIALGWSFNVSPTPPPPPPGGEVVDVPQVGNGNAPVFRDSDYLILAVVTPAPNGNGRLLLAQGGEATFRVRFINPKNIPLTDVDIMLTFDSRLDIVNVDSHSIGTPSVSGNTVILNGFILQPGQTGTLEVTVRVSGRARPGDILTSFAMLESPNASIHNSNLVEILVIPGSLPATGETEGRIPFLPVLIAISVVGLVTLLLMGRRRQVRPY